MQGNQQLLPAFAVAAAGLVWGVFWMPLRFLESHGLEGAWVTFGIHLFSCLVFLPILWRRRVRNRGSFRLRGPIVVIGLCLGGGYAFYFISLLLTDVLKTLALFYMTPVWGTLFGLWLLGERLNIFRALALLSCLGGMAVILGLGNHLPLPSNIGDWLALIGGISWAYGTTLLAQQRESRAMTQCFSMFVGGLVISFVALLLLPRDIAGAMPSGEVIAFAVPWLLAIAVVIFIPSNLIAIWGARTLSPGFVGMLFPLEIVIGTASSALFSDEPFGLRQALGSSLIILATLIEGFGQRFQRAPAPQAS